MRITTIAIIASALLLSACSGNTNDSAAAEPATTQTDAAVVETNVGDPATAPDGMTPEAHAAMEAGTTAPDATAAADSMAGMDHSNMPGMETGAATSGAQAGWYSAGMFQPCGSAERFKVSATDEIDAKLRAGKMSASDPVYVQLEGSAANGAFALTRVAQVGSPTPVRDCPMTGTTTQR